MDKENKSTGSSVVLLYHRIGMPRIKSTCAGQYVAPWLFAKQLDSLISDRWSAIDTAEIERRCLDGTPSGREDFCVTFDDGFQSVYEHAFPILKERKIPAVVYVVAGALGEKNVWNIAEGDVAEIVMTPSQVRDAFEQGFEIGSHTLSHPHLERLSDEEIERELVDSKHILEDVIGHEVKSLAYPYGGLDDRVLRIAAEAGYTNAMATPLGTVTKGTNRYRIPRINVRWAAVPRLLKKKIERAGLAG